MFFLSLSSAENHVKFNCLIVTIVTHCLSLLRNTLKCIPYYFLSLSILLTVANYMAYGG